MFASAIAEQTNDTLKRAGNFFCLFLDGYVGAGTISPLFMRWGKVQVLFTSLLGTAAY